MTTLDGYRTARIKRPQDSSYEGKGFVWKESCEVKSGRECWQQKAGQGRGRYVIVNKPE